MTEKLIIRDIRINESAGNSDSRMTSFEFSHLNCNKL